MEGSASSQVELFRGPRYSGFLRSRYNGERGEYDKGVGFGCFAFGPLPAWLPTPSRADAITTRLEFAAIEVDLEVSPSH